MLARFVASNAYLPTTSIVECVRYFLSACVESADAPLRGLFNEDLKWRISPPRRRPNSTNDEQAYQDGKAPLPSIRGEAIWCGRDARTEIPLGDVVASVRGRKSYVDARMRKNQRGPAHDDCVAYDTAPRGVVDKDHCRVRRVSPPPPTGTAKSAQRSRTCQCAVNQADARDLRQPTSDFIRRSSRRRRQCCQRRRNGGGRPCRCVRQQRRLTGQYMSWCFVVAVLRLGLLHGRNASAGRGVDGTKHARALTAAPAGGQPFELAHGCLRARERNA